MHFYCNFYNILTCNTLIFVKFDKKKGNQLASFFYKTNKPIRLSALLFRPFFLCIIPLMRHQSNMEQNLQGKTSTKNLLLGWSGKVKSLSIDQIQTYFL